MRKKTNTRPIRSDPKLFDEIQKIREKRIRKGKDSFNKPTKTARITLAMTRHPLWPQIKRDIINSDLP